MKPVKPLTRRPFRGSAIGYGHQATAYTFSQSAEPHYNPTWSHALVLAPEWHFSSFLFARARLTLSQEFTISDSTTRRNEIEWTDVTLDIGTKGFTEPFTKIKIGGDFRVAFPTSKASIFATRLLAIGPALSVSRTFGLRSGLTFAYGGRYSYRFHQFTTPRYLDIPNLSCNRTDINCLTLAGSGRRNAHSDMTHGPSISFAPFERVTIAAGYQMIHQWLYALPAAEVDEGVDPAADVPTRHFTNFDLSVSVQIFKPISISIGASTFSPQLNTYGTRYFPLFNRNTTLYLDASFDIEAAVSGLLGEST